MPVCRRKANLIARAAALATSNWLAAAALADPALPTGIPNDATHTFNITTYGASTLNTATANFTAINNAIGSLNAAGGGVLIVPAGTFVVNPGLTIKTKTNLQIDGTLQAPPMASYGSAGTNFLNTTSSSTDILISGSGTIDGNATFSTGAGDSEWWGNPTLNISAAGTRPRLLRVNSCTRFELTGVHLQNSPQFHVSFNGTISQFTIDNVSINAPSNAPNTDAIDLTGNNGLVKNSFISVGDDNVVLKPQSTNCSTITVSSCTFGSGHGISIGGQTQAGANTYIIANCTFNGTANGIHLKAGRVGPPVGTVTTSDGGGLVQNVTTSNLVMTNVASPFDISSYYVNGGDQTNPLTPQHAYSNNPSLLYAPVLADLPKTFMTVGTPQWQNLSFSSITINGSASSNNFFYGVPESPIQNLVLNSVNFQTTPSKGLNFINCADVHLTSSIVAPVQCAIASSMELSGNPGAPPTLTQTFSSSLAAQAATLKSQVDAGTLVLSNYDTHFNPDSVNTFHITGDFDLGKTAGTAGAYNLNGGTLLVDGTAYIGNAGTGVLSQTTGLLSAASVVLGNTAGGTGSLTITGGVYAAGSTAIKNNSRFNYNAGNVSTGSLQLASSGKLTVSPGGNKTLVSNWLTMDPTSQLDLADNYMVIDYSGPIGSLAGDVRDDLFAGRLVSSAHPANTVLGYADNSVALRSMLGSVSLDLSSVLVFNATPGDTNLNGIVDVNDLTNLALHWQQPADSLWTGGDFNYDGTVDIKDLMLLVPNLQLPPPALGAMLTSLGLPAVAVPEPAAATLLAACIFTLRRRRQSR